MKTSPSDIATSKKTEYKAFIVKKLEGTVRTSFAIWDMLPEDEKTEQNRWHFEAAMLDLILLGTIQVETSGIPYGLWKA